jgi:hypothetical protein
MIILHALDARKAFYLSAIYAMETTADSLRN